MRLHVAIERPPGARRLRAYIVQGNNRGRDLLSKRSTANVEDAKRFVYDALRRNCGPDVEIDFEVPEEQPEPPPIATHRDEYGMRGVHGPQRTASERGKP
jgi:hypothetical protein